MIIAVTYENGEIFQHFGHTEEFKVYEIDENKKIVKMEIVNTNGQGHGALAGFLRDKKIELLICGGIGGGARMVLSEMGIRVFPGVTGNADVAVEKLLIGDLEYYSGATCGHHHDGASAGCNTHSCDGHSCH